MLIDKYTPIRIKEIIGQSEPLRKLVLCIKEKKHAILCGPVGCGKTASVHAISNELGFDILELNSSDFRNKNKIHEILGNSIQQQSLFSKSKVILVDELEGLSGIKDRGCITELSQLLSISHYPIIMICNKISDKIKSLKKNAYVIDFNEVEHNTIYSFLNIICMREKLDVNEQLLRNISCDCKGDIRAAINDLDALNISSRERKSTIQDSIKLVFKSKLASSSLSAFDNIEEDLDECLLWIDENLPAEYSKQDLSRAYDFLSKADIFRKRITRWQYFRFLTYINSFLTAGITSSKEKVNENNTYYKRSSRILKIWIAKQRNMKKRELAVELSKKLHCSVKKTITEMPFLEISLSAV